SFQVEKSKRIISLRLSLYKAETTSMLLDYRFEKIITFAVLCMISLALIDGILFNVSSEPEVVKSAEVQNISEAVFKWKSVVQSEV
ncbi:MAG: hypothetical protein ABS902_09940, partial [Priestia megaterium]